MSLILDALRKMEQERKSRRGTAQDLRPEVLRYRLSTQPKQPKKYPLVIVGVVLVCAGVGAGFLIKGSGARSVEAQAPAAAPSAPVTVPAPPPASPASASAPTAAPMPVEQAAAPMAVKPAEPSPAASDVSKAKGSRVASSGLAGALPAEPAPVPQSRPQRDSSVQVHTGNDIVISGIAYQDERRLRRAVLNGQLLGEGAEIAGARVVEIRETKVRFSRGGQLFDVPFSSGLQSR